MRLTSNYSRKDWTGLSLHLLVSAILPGCFFLFLFFNTTMVFVYMLPDSTPYLTNEEFILEIRDGLLEKGYYLDTILVFYIFTVSGPIIITLVAGFWLWQKSMELGQWIVKKWIHYNPKFELFWDGVPLDQTKWGSRAQRLDDWGKSKKDK